MSDFLILHRVPMFSAMDETELASLYKLMRRHVYAPGEVILQEGATGDSIHILLEGNARILTRDSSDREVLLDEVGHGSFFGELSLITGDPRSATVRAVGEVVTLALNHDDFHHFLENNANACLDVITVLGQRLGRSSALLRMTTRNVNDIEREQRTLGQKIADSCATAMGSWTFIVVQTVLMIVYIAWNVIYSTRHWDPYPFLLMSLILAIQAAYTAPVIMMSQNRQSDKDRLMAENNYQVNMKASAEIGLILERLDDLERHLAPKTNNNALPEPEGRSKKGNSP